MENENEIALEEIETLATSSVSSGDVYSVQMVESVDIASELQALNYTVSALLFVVLYAVCEQKIKSGIRRLFKVNG